VVLSLQQGGDKALQKFSYPDYAELHEQAGAAFSDVAAYTLTLSSLTSDKVGDHSLVTRVSGNYFSMLGVQPALGRLILPSEGQAPGADPVIVLGYAYWQKRFAGDTSVLSKHVELGGHAMTIVGVAPKDFHGAYFIVNSDLYVPLSADIEAGYASDLEALKATIRAVIEAGAVGINFEDSMKGGANELFPVETALARIKAVRETATAAGVPIVINARTDVFLHAIGDKTSRFDHTVSRANAYLGAGADCVFVPGPAAAELIGKLTAAIQGPINVMVLPGMPSAPELEKLGVARVSMGGGPARAAGAHRRGHLRPEHLDQHPADRVSVQHAIFQLLHRKPPPEVRAYPSRRTSRS